MKIITSKSYTKLAEKVSYDNFEFRNEYLEEPFTIQRGNVTYYVVAPHSAEGSIRKEYVTDFRGNLDREDSYTTQNIEEIRVSIGDVEKVWDENGNKYDPYQFTITPEEERIMKQEVKDHYYNVL